MTKTRLRLERRGKYEMKKERAGEGWEHRKEGGRVGQRRNRDTERRDRDTERRTLTGTYTESGC